MTPQPLPYATPMAAMPTTGMSADQLYQLVPWYRQNWFVSLMVLLGLCIGFPLVAACIIVLTGPVYFPKRAPDGRLKTWGSANKVVAVILLAIWIWVFVARLARAF
jgi:amino acid transporter